MLIYKVLTWGIWLFYQREFQKLLVNEKWWDLKWCLKELWEQRGTNSNYIVDSSLGRWIMGTRKVWCLGYERNIFLVKLIGSDRLDKWDLLELSWIWRELLSTRKNMLWRWILEILFLQLAFFLRSWLNKSKLCAVTHNFFVLNYISFCDI